MNSAKLITLADQELLRLFLAIVLLLGAAHTFGYLFQRFKMPRVIGEITGGVVLGPSLGGFLFPETYAQIFNGFDAEPKLLSTIYWLGLVLLMFISGFEIQKSINRQERRLISAILLGGTVMPFLAGWLTPVVYDCSSFVGEKGNLVAFQIIVGIAVAVTSIPVISKIFLDLNVINTRFAKIIVVAATIEDVILWGALAVATGIASREQMSLLSISSTVLLSLTFFAVCLFIMPRLMAFGNELRINVLVRSSVSGYTLLICFLFATMASLLGINVVFGALLAGVVVGSMPGKEFANVKTHIKEVSLGFFIPIYFAIVGLRLDLIHHFDILPLVGFLLFASGLKMGGTLLAAKLLRQNWLSGINLAVAMNTRGGPGIVLATVAFDLGIISESFFVILVMVSILTSLVAGYWFTFVLSKGWDLLAGGPPQRVEQVVTRPAQETPEIASGPAITVAGN